MTIKNELTARFWDSRAKRKTIARTRWWESPEILKHINKKICGEPVDGFNQGLIKLLRTSYGSLLPLQKGIAVACGEGSKEMKLIKLGIVKEFDLFELARKRIKIGKQIAREEGFLDRMNFLYGDAFEKVQESGLYDFVHWDNALHHMLDVNEAIAWSHKVLKKNGIFFMNEYVGPCRFQWTDRMIRIGKDVRESLADEFLKDPYSPASLLPRTIRKPSLQRIMKIDPSEAADSERIIPGVKKYFPDANIILTGGVVYHGALNDVIHNIRDESDLLKPLLLLDDQCIKMGDTHYAVALAIKS